MISNQQFIASLTVMAPLLIIINDLVVFNHPAVFFNRHSNAIIIQVANYSFITCVIVGIAGGIYLAFRSNRQWAWVTLLTVVVAAGSVALSILAGGGLSH